MNGTSPTTLASPLERLLGRMSDGGLTSIDFLHDSVSDAWDKAELRRQLGRLVDLGVVLRVKAGNYMLAEPDADRADPLLSAELAVARSIIDELLVPQSLGNLRRKLPRVTERRLERLVFKMLHLGHLRRFVGDDGLHQYQSRAEGIAALRPPTFELIHEDQRALLVVQVLSAVGEASVREINELAPRWGVDPRGLDVGRRCRVYAQSGLLVPTTTTAAGQRTRFALGPKGRVLRDLVGDSLGGDVRPLGEASAQPTAVLQRGNTR